MIKAPVTKNLRQQEVLIGLVEFFLTTGKPCGSNTLRENGFEQISSATIRNYFSDLEKEGYLKQQHTSGGRTPTDKALRLYIESILSRKKKHTPPTDDKEFLHSIISKETKNLAFYLQEVTEAISELSSLTTIISAPRFDQDFITKIMLTKIDAGRALCIILTDFGFIHTETIYFPANIDSFSLKAMEEYFHYRLTSLEKPKLSEEEEAFAKHTYNEVVLRHFISYSNMDHPDIYKGGFSKLLRHSEFHDPETLANTLSLFENNSYLQKLLFENEKLNILIGDDLK